MNFKGRWFGFINWVDKANWSSSRISKAYVLSASPSLELKFWKELKNILINQVQGSVTGFFYYLLLACRVVQETKDDLPHFNWFQTLQLMTGVRWDIRDIMSQHNAYVDILVRVQLIFRNEISICADCFLPIILDS